jgi:L-lactate dehydrogenase
MTMTDVKRIAVIGAGLVGATSAYALMMSRIASEIVLVDVDHERAVGEAMDLNHGIPYVSNQRIWAGTYEDVRDANITVITAGANQKPGETRLDLVKRNSEILKGVVDSIVAVGNEGILLVVANPVDVLSYVAWKLSGWDSSRVIGSGTVLDTARLRHHLGRHFNVDPRSVHAYILGEHGDSEMALWSSATIGNVPLSQFPQYDLSALERIFQDTRTAAYQIIQRKRATYYAIGLGVARICEAVLLNQHSVLSVSTLATGQYGIEDVYLSLPSVVGVGGVQQVLTPPMNGEEIAALRHSAEVLKGTLWQIDIHL